MPLTIYTDTEPNAAVQVAGRRHVVSLDDCRDTFEPLLREKLTILQNTIDRGQALAALVDLDSIASEIAQVAREAREAMKVTR